MQNHSARSNLFILIIEIFMIVLVVSFVYKIISLNSTLEKELQAKQEMILISDELRQSSDDLTHFARTYVVTNDKKYQKQYFQILGIRDGKAPRPKMYETIYWDLNKEIREKRHPDGEKSSLKERISKLPFTQEEKELLHRSEENSNDLVHLEVEAFKLMDFIKSGIQNQEQAIAMLHSKEYYQAKHKIMDPIDKFMIQLNQRIAIEAVEINATMKRYIIFMFLSTLLLIVVNIYFYFYLRNKDTKSLIAKRKFEKRFQDLIESSSNWIWEVDTLGRYTYSSHQVEKLLGYRVDEVLSKTPFDFMMEEEKAKVGKTFTEKVAKHEDIIELENINIHKNGTKVYMLSSGSPFFDEDGELLGYRGMDMDITAQKTLELHLESKVAERTKDLAHQAHHDSLTSLPNRLLFNDRLELAIEKASRKQNKIALLFIDLDHFKEINDSLGHGVGDKVLKEVALRLSHILREEDTLARLGGDEFTVILENLNLGQDASLLASKIIKALTAPLEIEEHTLYVSSSIGISLYPDDGLSAQNLLKFSDAAMYKAKDEGRNNFQYYSAEMTELAFERVVMETSLREALVNEDFVVYYQPQVNGISSALIGMEALVRWNHPTMGIVSPAKFIPLAESTGLIVELDRLVMRIAMTQLVQWYSDGLNPGVLALNLSVKQLQQKDFIDVLQNLLEETGCKAQWLELEVTEGQIMNNPQEAIKILSQISNLGIELAIDDFGTGYSSLAYLKKLPVNKLKIDQAFVRDLPDDEEDAGITKAVIALANSLHLRVIAEGVETQAQKDFIVEHGCHNIQGYFYSKPLPCEDMEVFIINGVNNEN